VHAGFWWGNLERDHSEDLGVGGTVILKGSSRSGIGGRDRIDLAQDRGRWRDDVNAVMNIRVSKNAGNLLTT
jgi:hypothetical protein